MNIIAIVLVGLFFTIRSLGYAHEEYLDQVEEMGLGETYCNQVLPPSQLHGVDLSTNNQKESQWSGFKPALG